MDKSSVVSDNVVDSCYLCMRKDNNKKHIKQITKINNLSDARECKQN